MNLRSTLATLATMASVAVGATYHIARTGSDARSPTEAGSPATPWASFANLAGLALMPGDSILLKRGDTLRGILKFSRSGSKASPITIAPYGPGTEPPTILGTIPVTSWTSNGSGAWKAKIPSDHPVNRLYAAGLPLRNARWPDTGWFRSTSHSGDTMVILREAAAGDWTGASLYLWNLNWDMEGHRVKSQSGDKIVLERKNNIAISDTALWALTNHPLALKVRGTWVYVASDSTLLYLGDQPADFALEASVHSANVDLRGANWVHLRGLRLLRAADTGITANGQGVVVEDCHVRFADHVGIYLAGADNVLRDCQVSGSSSSGISVRSMRGLVERNDVRRIMVADWLGPNGMGATCCTGNGINVWGDTSLARWNRVDSIGFNGIAFGGLGTKVTENHASHFCMLANDCAGIYTAPQLPPQRGSEGSRVWRNIVHDAHKSAWPWPWAASNGIYLDAHAHDIVADSNTMWNIDKGFHGNNGRGIVYRDNLVYGSRYSPGDFANNDSANLSTPIGATIQGNLVVALPGSRSEFTRFIPQGWQSKAELRATGNIICQDQMSRIVCSRDSFKIWSAPTVDPNGPLFGKQVIPNGSFDSTTLSWRRWPAQLTLALDSLTSCPTAHCLRIDWKGDTVAGSPYLSTGPVIRTDSGQGWWLQFRARSKRAGMKITAVLRRPVDYASIGPAFNIVLDTSWQDLSFHFKANQKFDTARLDIHVPKKDSTIWLDDILLRKEGDSAAYAALGPRTTLLWNATSTPSSQSLPPGRWVDESGHEANSPVQIPSYAGRVFFGIIADPVGVRNAAATQAIWSVRHQAGALLLSGLSSPADLFDPRGRRIVRLTPDATGQSRWLTGPRKGLVWIRSGGQARAAVIPR